MTQIKKVLVTGGAGYIGSHTIVELLASGKFEVISIDNFSNSRPEALSRIEDITGKKIRNVNIDMCDEKALRSFFESESDIAGVIHFAAFKSVPESVAEPLRYYRNNITSLVNLLNCCIANNISNFLFSSSCSVYGNISDLPVTEESLMSKTESPYAYTKVVGEHILCDTAASCPSLQAISLRYFNPVGAHVSGRLGEFPAGRPNNLVPVITQTAIGKLEEVTVFGNDYPTRDGSCIRDYVHVTDIALAHVIALEHLMIRRNTRNYEVYNLGTGTGVSVLEAIKMFEEVSGLKLNYKIGPRRSGDVCAIYSDTTKAGADLGWKAKFDLREMMSSAWKWENFLKSSQ
jgi:UDP-glucose 4-epimerase